MKSIRSWFILIFILTTNFCDAQFQSQRFYGDSLSYAYIVLFDNDNQVTAGNKLKVEQRLEQLERIIEKESLGKLYIDAVPVYVNVQTLDVKNLDYKHHSFFEWMDLFFENEVITSETDIVSFTPAIQIPWADDSRSRCLDFSGSLVINKPEQYYGEIQRVIGVNTNYDRSPYICNNRNEHGQIKQ
jgi:hypothetical protein